MEPKFLYWEATLEIYNEDENGKIKKVRETHLIDAANPTEVESKVKEERDGMMSDYVIKSIKRSNVAIVY